MISLPQLARPLHCVCVHLSLFARSRRWQLGELADYIDAITPPDAPLLVAGDFNDWRNHAGEILAHRLGLHEIFTHTDLHGDARPSRSYPAALPLFRLDRIYQRGLTVGTAHRHSGPPWSSISDHAALSATLNIAA
jgi:endonuclease/exonuclease/phosphatase family metal-dependent hydrolase